LAENKSAKNVYIQSATLTGKPLRIPVARHDEIVVGTSPKLEGLPHGQRLEHKFPED
jgi:putative alpha-1,2-mannosidase